MNLKEKCLLIAGASSGTGLTTAQATLAAGAQRR